MTYNPCAGVPWWLETVAAAGSPHVRVGACVRVHVCTYVSQGGPQIIRAHVTGQAQGKNGGVRSRACTSPPTTLKEEWSRPPLSKEQKLQQKADRLEAKRLKAELKKASGATLAAIQQDDGGGTKRSLTDHMTLSLQTDQVKTAAGPLLPLCAACAAWRWVRVALLTDGQEPCGPQVEVVCNLRDDVRRVYVTESIALHELRQRLCAEYGAEALDIRYRGDDGGFGPMHSQHHLDLAKAMASQAACALYLSLAAQGSDDFSTLGLGAQRPCSRVVRCPPSVLRVVRRCRCLHTC